MINLFSLCSQISKKIYSGMSADDAIREHRGERVRFQLRIEEVVSRPIVRSEVAGELIPHYVETIGSGTFHCENIGIWLSEPESELWLRAAVGQVVDMSAQIDADGPLEPLSILRIGENKCVIGFRLVSPIAHSILSLETGKSIGAIKANLDELSIGLGKETPMKESSVDWVVRDLKDFRQISSILISDVGIGELCDFWNRVQLELETFLPSPSSIMEATYANDTGELTCYWDTESGRGLQVCMTAAESWTSLLNSVSGDSKSTDSFERIVASALVLPLNSAMGKRIFDLLYTQNCSFQIEIDRSAIFSLKWE